MAKLAIIDYGCGNLFSLSNALRAVGADYVVTDRREVIAAADKIILPGVGAFGEAASKLAAAGLTEFVCSQAAQKPLLGICVGAQLLFQTGYEFGTHKGLGLLPGEVRKIRAEGLKIPHMGWNEVRLTDTKPYGFTKCADGRCFYFVHTYKIDAPREAVLASAQYGEEIPAIVGRGKVFGFQFHPEKSGDAGLELLTAFVKEAL